MSPLTIKSRWWHNLIKKLAATPFGIWLLSNTLHRIDISILKLTRNRTSLTSWLAGLPVILLTTVGAKSSTERQVPLVALVDGDKLILIASFFGSHRNPGWYYNLRAHPLAQVAYNDQAKPYLARQAEGEERRRYWEVAEGLYHGYGLNKRRASNREIPIMVLEPLETHDNQS